MSFSDNTNSLIEKINDHTQEPLKNVYEVSVIIENSIKDRNFDLFKELIFTAKYVKGLKSVLSNQIINRDDFMERMFEEFNKNVQKFSDNLNISIDSSGDNIKSHFNRKYFELNHTCLINVMELIEDLSKCKEFFNSNPEYLLKLQETGNISL